MLQAQIYFYAGPILRLQIDEVDGFEKRFRTSEIPDLAVMDK